MVLPIRLGLSSSFLAMPKRRNGTAMRRVHVVGRKNAGKTTLMIELIRELTGRGCRVGTIKHTPHNHYIDTRGKDSFRHCEAGASPAALITGNATAIFLPEQHGERTYEELAPFYETCHLVLVEGNLETGAPKVEVWRAGASGEPLARTRNDITAVITDEEIDVSVPVWPRTGLTTLANEFLALAGLD